MAASRSECLLIINPAAGRGACRRLAPEIVAALKEVGFQPRIYRTEGPGDAREQARGAAAAGIPLVIAAGGDGTASEIASGLICTQTALAVLPAGTGNDLARHLGIDLNPVAAARQLQSTRLCPIDVGFAAGRPFILAAGIGFDAAVARRINGGLRWVRGPAAYAAALGATLCRYRPSQMRVEVDGEVTEFEGYLVAVTNARGYGGGMKIAPAASLQDGMLDVCCIHTLPRLQFLSAARLVYSGRHIEHPAVQMFQGQKISVQSDPPAPVVLDGEIHGPTPLGIEVMSAALTLCIPDHLENL